MTVFQHFDQSSVSLTDRTAVELDTFHLLNQLSIPYTGIDHEEAYSLEACRALEKELGGSICKNLFLCNRQRTEHYLLLMDGMKPFKTKYLSAQINSSRLSFAPEEDLLKYLSVFPGSASVLALVNDTGRAVKLLIDRPLLENEYIGFHPCKNTSTLLIRTSDILYRFLPAVQHEPVIIALPEIEE